MTSTTTPRPSLPTMTATAAETARRALTMATLATLTMAACVAAWFATGVDVLLVSTALSILAALTSMARWRHHDRRATTATAQVFSIEDFLASKAACQATVTAVFPGAPSPRTHQAA